MLFTNQLKYYSLTTTFKQTGSLGSGRAAVACQQQRSQRGRAIGRRCALHGCHEIIRCSFHWGNRFNSRPLHGRDRFNCRTLHWRNRFYGKRCLGLFLIAWRLRFFSIVAAQETFKETRSMIPQYMNQILRHAHTLQGRSSGRFGGFRVGFATSCERGQSRCAGGGLVAGQGRERTRALSH